MSDLSLFAIEKDLFVPFHTRISLYFLRKYIKGGKFELILRLIISSQIRKRPSLENKS
jgi:hypothetical protein